MTPRDDTAAVADEAAAARLTAQRRQRRWLLRGLFGVIVFAGAGWAAYYVLVGRWYESTDDAYVSGNVVQITPQVPGTVVGIGADDNDYVKKGQTLVKLDRSDADVALAKAEAALAQTVRNVRGMYSTVHRAEAEVALRQAAVEQARADYRRRKGLAAIKAISAEELAHAFDALTSAESSLAAARAQQATASAMVAGTRIATHPDVQAAAAAVRAAWLDDQRMTLVAPVAGYVATRTVQVGQRVQPGTPLMAVVPLDEVWVDANFKETQLEQMRIGQRVASTSDLYGGSVTYRGRVTGLGIGTGSAFSLLPAQNATGNWIKIVQRLPVRIALDSKELSAHPLRIGLSMHVEVDLHDQSGTMLSRQPPIHPIFSTDVFARSNESVDALIAQIIRANSDSAAAPPSASHRGATVD
jgi:membrane fusion protein (multidrug efflux system)